MTSAMTPFRRLVTALHAEGVSFILIGGLAARLHGSARITDDVDVCYARNRGNLQRLVKALAPFSPYLRGAPPGLPFAWSADTLRAGLNFTLTTTGGSIDLLGDVAGVGGYEDMQSHTVTMALFGLPTEILDLDWLIRAKRAAGRPKDLEVVAELETIRELRDGG